MSARFVPDDSLCAHCFNVLTCYFNGAETPPLPMHWSHGIECPMFVTLHIISGSGMKLRGCIGTLSPRPLEAISEYVMLSAFEDKRFSPLRHEELQHLDISFSALVNFEDAQNYLDWEVSMLTVFYTAIYLNHVNKLHSFLLTAGYAWN
jgi:AMMECR1 domain-containing protein